MFMLKSLFSKVWGDPNTKELASVSAGELYIVRPRSSVKGARECIFQSAMATVRRTNQDFNYQLVITRVYEEGEEGLLDEDDETDDERAFLIDTALEFRSDTFDGQPTFLWRDLDGDEDDLFEFVATNANEPTRAFFELSVLRAIYERKHQKTSEKAREADLKKLIYTPPLQATSRPRTRQAAATDVNKELAEASRDESTSNAPPASVAPMPRSTIGDDPSSYEGRTMVSEPADLLFFDYSEDAFVVQDTVDAKIILSPRVNFQYFIVAETAEDKWLAHELMSDLNCKWAKGWKSFRWNNRDREGKISAWCLRFNTDEAYEHFKEVLTRCLWETNNGISWEKAKKEDTTYAADTFKDEDVEMRDAYESEEEEEETVEEVLQSDSDDEEPSKLREEDDEDEDEDEYEETKKFYAKTGAGGQEQNSAMTVGYNNDRTFVVRNHRIGVFKNTDSNDGGMQHAGTINKVTTLKGKVFSPKKVMLHEQDKAMVIMNPDEPNNLYKMDLTVGKVVEEWKVHDDIPVTQMAPDSKFAQTTHQQTLVGTSHNALFRIDPRLSGQKMVDAEYKQYATKAAFSSVATTAGGHLAVASAKGDIRMFDTIGKNAKTALPALGDPIIGVDVTASGRYIVATCKTHLYVIDTMITEGRYKDSLGFERSFPANARPVPKRLQLKPEHVLYMGSEVSFTPARFNTGPDQDETSIVTSSGPYVIAWDFKKVKQGVLDKYEIKQYDDKVVQDEFRFANDRDIVVALKNNVLMVNKKKLKKPTPMDSSPTLHHSKNDIFTSSWRALPPPPPLPLSSTPRTGFGGLGRSKTTGGAWKAKLRSVVDNDLLDASHPEHSTPDANHLPSLVLPTQDQASDHPELQRRTISRTTSFFDVSSRFAASPVQQIPPTAAPSYLYDLPVSPTLTTSTASLSHASTFSSNPSLSAAFPFSAKDGPLSGTSASDYHNHSAMDVELRLFPTDDHLLGVGRYSKVYLASYRRGKAEQNSSDLMSPKEQGPDERPAQPWTLCAVKKLDEDEESQRLGLREAWFLRQLASPVAHRNIVVQAGSLDEPATTAHPGQIRVVRLLGIKREVDPTHGKSHKPRLSWPSPSLLQQALEGPKSLIRHSRHTSLEDELPPIQLTPPASIQPFLPNSSPAASDQKLLLVLPFAPTVLSDVIQHQPRLLTPTRHTTIALQLSQAVAFVHSQFIIHTDIKPHNILLTSTFDVLLSDFNTAIHLPSVSLTGLPDDPAGLGTPVYSPPEFNKPPPSPFSYPADVWALGVTLMVAIVGREPYARLVSGRRAKGGRQELKMWLRKGAYWQWEDQERLDALTEDLTQPPPSASHGTFEFPATESGRYIDNINDEMLQRLLDDPKASSSLLELSVPPETIVRGDVSPTTGREQESYDDGTPTLRYLGDGGLSQDTRVSQRVLSLLRSMCSASPSSRPSIDKVVKKLERELSDHVRRGENRGHTITPLERRRKIRKAGGEEKRTKSFVKNIIREVTGFAPYEKRIMELLRNNKDKKAKKLSKKRLGTMKRAKTKIEELGTILAESRRAH
ncbi:hypothetical protein FRB99_005830 [Tulasnella sp. 403]|nr:hypothetical protein FRB99_005830 [Tulasnella sp. 403]